MLCSRRTAVLGALTLLVGCAPAHTSTTVAPSAPLASPSPPLPVLVLRTARSGLALDASEVERVDDLIDDAEKASRPLGRARSKFVELLAQSVERGALDPPTMRFLSEHVVHAAQEGLPALRASIDRLFRLLGPRRQEALAELMEEPIRTWAPSWRSSAEHPWITEPGAMASFDDDLVATTRGWTEKTIRAVDGVLPHLDGDGRVALAASLRVSDGAPP